MTLTDLAAVIGALAWLPPIIVGIQAWFKKPMIRVITQPAPEIGYTTQGPILNLRIALTVTHRDIVVTGIRLKVQHDSGEVTMFSWRGIMQRMGTMTFPQVGAVPFEKELDVLAMKVSLKDVEERFIRFQKQDYLKRKAESEDLSVRKIVYLRKTAAYDPGVFLKSQEMVDIYSFIRQSFSWKPGSYHMRIELESPDSFDVLDNEYAFTLTPIHVQNLSDNLKHIEDSYARDINQSPPDIKGPTVPWQWSYPDMQLVQPNPRRAR